MGAWFTPSLGSYKQSWQECACAIIFLTVPAPSFLNLQFRAPWGWGGGGESEALIARAYLLFLESLPPPLHKSSLKGSQSCAIFLFAVTSSFHSNRTHFGVRQDLFPFPSTLYGAHSTRQISHCCSFQVPSCSSNAFLAWELSKTISQCR